MLMLLWVVVNDIGFNVVGLIVGSSVDYTFNIFLWDGVFGCCC